MNRGNSCGSMVRQRGSEEDDRGKKKKEIVPPGVPGLCLPESDAYLGLLFCAKSTVHAPARHKGRGHHHQRTYLERPSMMMVVLFLLLLHNVHQVVYLACAKYSSNYLLRRNIVTASTRTYYIELPDSYPGTFRDKYILTHLCTSISRLRIFRRDRVSINDTRQHNSCSSTHLSCAR